MRGGITGMIQEAVMEECGIGTTMRARDLIQKGIHIVGMTVSMVESETDMKVPGECLVCNCYFLFLVSILELIQILKPGNVMDFYVLGILKTFFCVFPIILN